MPTDQTIIDKLERANGPDRELDAEIAQAVGMCLHPNKTRNGAQSDTGFDCDDCGADSWGNRSNDGFNRRLSDSCPAYTASIDAAMTLGRDDWERADMMLTAMGALGNPDYMKAGAWLKMLPIHLCIAALRARSQGGE